MYSTARLLTAMIKKLPHIDSCCVGAIVQSSLLCKTLIGAKLLNKCVCVFGFQLWFHLCARICGCVQLGLVACEQVHMI